MDDRHIARTLELADLEVETSRREVIAYAAVFDAPTHIRDHQGEYWERIARNAFDVTIRDNAGGVKAMVNHARDVYGMPSDRFSLPYGVVESMRPDGRGLLTVTKVARTDLGDEVLELMRSGALDGFSFSGRVLQTTRLDPARPDDMPTLVRTEIALREFGPAVFRAYDQAKILAVRSGTPLPLDSPPVSGTPDGVSDRSSIHDDQAPADGSVSDVSEQGNDSTPKAADGPNPALKWLRDNLR